MSLSGEEVEFLSMMALQLDETIQFLGGRQRQLEMMMGLVRVGELREVWESKFIGDMDECQSGLDSRERELFSVWIRKERAHEQRLRVGRHLMTQPPMSQAATFPGI